MIRFRAWSVRSGIAGWCWCSTIASTSSRLPPPSPWPSSEPVNLSAGALVEGPADEAAKTEAAVLRLPVGSRGGVTATISGSIHCDAISARCLACSGHTLPLSRGLRRGRTQRHGAHQIVRHSEPQQHRPHFILPPQQQALETTVAQIGVDTLGLGTTAINRLAVLARHSLARCRGSGTIALSRRKRVGLVLVARRRREHLNAFGMRFLDIFEFGEAAIDQVLLWGLPVARADLLLHWPDQTVIRAGGIDIHGDNHLGF